MMEQRRDREERKAREKNGGLAVFFGIMFLFFQNNEGILVI